MSIMIIMLIIRYTGCQLSIKKEEELSSLRTNLNFKIAKIPVSLFGGGKGMELNNPR